MGTFNYYNGNLAFYRTDFRNFIFDETASTDQLAVFVFDTNAATFDPYATAWRIELVIEGMVFHTITEGPFAGEEVPIAGTVTAIRQYNAQGTLIMEGSGLTADVVTLARLIDTDDRRAWDVLTQGDHVFNGANDSGVDWQGDDINTTAGSDIVNANGGDDFIKDAGGRDSYIGGAGWDTLSYADHWFWNNPGGALVGLRVDLGAGTVRGPDKQVDTLSGIESVRGTHLNDTMVGSSGSDQFMGLGGNDRFDGLGGFDEVRYDRDDRFMGYDGISANMAKGRVRDGFGTTDRIANIEAIRGSNMRDRIYDDMGDNRIRGEGGDDYINVSGGNDTLRGGIGRDQFVFTGTSFGIDVIEDFSKADRDRIQILAADDMGDLTLRQDGTTAVIRLNGSSQIRVLNFDIDDFAAGDFIF